MRKIIFEIGVSLDGFIEGSNGELTWQIAGKEAAHTKEFLSRFDTIFYGRMAYEKFGVPRENDETLTEEKREFNNAVCTMRKYVFSRHLKHVAGNGMMINGNMVSEIKRLKEEEGKDIWFCGGADILRSFIGLNVIDEYRLSIHPVILGSGKPLFRKLKARLNLKLISAERQKSGVVMLHYKPEKK